MSPMTNHMHVAQDLARQVDHDFQLLAIEYAKPLRSYVDPPSDDTRDVDLIARIRDRQRVNIHLAKMHGLLALVQSVNDLGVKL